MLQSQVESLTQDKQKLERDNQYLLGKLMLVTGLERLDEETVQEVNSTPPQPVNSRLTWPEARRKLESDARKRREEAEEMEKTINVG